MAHGSFDEFSEAHSVRFRTFGNGYPRMVALAYGRHLERAMSATDKQVARQVVRWARREGLPRRNYAVAERVAAGKGR